MMVLFNSFTSTFLRFADGDIKPSQLQYASFKFACWRSHVIVSPDKRAEMCPAEVSWAHKARHKKDGFTTQLMPADEPNGWIPRSNVHPEVIELWDQFFSIVEKADKDGRVEWRDPR